MTSNAGEDDFAPGTLCLERILDNHETSTILHPVPTASPNDPLNWSSWYKVLNFSLVCYYTLAVFVNLDIGTLIWVQLNSELGISFELANISFGLNCAGSAVGCIIFIPFALKYGRRIIYLVSISLSLATCIWQARMQTGSDLLGASLVSGLAGATAETICQMTIADIFFVHQRGAANAVYLLMVNMGAFLSLIPAGYVANSEGWRWIWWWAAILLAICLVLFAVLYEDTKYSPRAEVLTTENEPRSGSSSGGRGNTPKHSNAPLIQELPTSALDPNSQRKTYFQKMALLNTTSNSSSIFHHFYQPFQILFTFPAIAFSAVTYGSLLAWLSMTVTTYSVYFTLPPYNFGPESLGLINLPSFFGGLLGSLFGYIFADRSVIWLSKRNKGIFEPEMRLWLAIPGIVVMPAGLLWFGLSISNSLPWIVPAIGLAFFGFGFVVLGDVALTYAMDCYKDIIGDAFVGIIFVRNVCATVIATTATPWIDGMGLANVFILSSVLALVLSLLTIPMMVYGKRMRRWTSNSYEVYQKRQYVLRKD